MKSTRAEDYRYYLIPGGGVAIEYSHIYNEAYRVWRSVWSQAFLELDGSDAINSDDFTRQDFIGAIFQGDRCAALLVHHDANFNYQPAREDSYFKAWPPEALEALVRNGKAALICSHLTVDPAFRGEFLENLPMKNLIMAMSVRFLLRSDYDVMTGTMRNNRGANKTAYATGATPILPDASMHGVNVDLVGWYKSEALLNTNLDGHPWVEALWASRKILPLYKAIQQQLTQAA